MRILRFAWLKTNSSIRHRRLCLEPLEDRCLPSTVTNLADAGTGSLRDAIAATPPGGTVDFQQGLSGTITLTSASLAIAKDLTIFEPGTLVGAGPFITVSGNKMFQVFKIASGVSATISGLTIANGVGNVGAGNKGGGIYNDGTLTVSNSTLSGNGAGFGGGIYNDGTLTVSNSTLSGNGAGFVGGGGIFNAGTLTVTNSTLSGNSTGEGSGGGIFNDGGLTVDSSIFSGNYAQTGLGGGIRGQGAVSRSMFLGNYASEGSAIDGSFTISRCIFSGNGGEVSVIQAFGPLTISDSTIAGNGGGSTIDVVGPGPLTMTNCEISGNKARLAAIFTGTGMATISNSTISANLANHEGSLISAIFTSGTVTINNSTISGNLYFDAGSIDNGGKLTVSNSTISGNTAGLAGGIFNEGTLTIINSTISGNTAYFPAMQQQEAGGIANYPQSSDATVLLLNCTIANNTISGNGGSELFSGQGPQPGSGKATVLLRNTIVSGDGSKPNLSAGTGGTFISQGHNLSNDNASGFLTGPGDLINGNPLLGPLQDNGGPTQTMALLPGSSAVDAGDNIGAPVLDQRGLPRIVGGTIDMGAFEVQPGLATHFQVSAPARVTAGMPFNVMVTSLDAYNHTAVGYLGTVTFRSSDPGPGVVLPPNYAFTPADSGVHIFTNGVTLRSAGAPTVTATDTLASSISGSASIVVTLPVSIVTTTSVNPSVYGQPVTFTAVVTSSGSPVTTGTVTFQEGSTVLAASVPLDSSGHASFPSATLTAAGSPHIITAYYSGTTTFAPNSGNFSQMVNKAPLLVTADDQTKVYGQANPLFAARYTGFVLGETQNVLSSTLSFSTPATTNSNAGTYAIAPSGLTSPNYTITFANGTLTVTTAPLTVTANNASKVYGQANPAFSASFSGFVLGQSPSVLEGTLAFSTPATNGSNVDSYPITPSGLTSSNYATTFVNGRLTVGPAPLIVIAGNVSRTYGAANPPLTGAIAGIQNGDPITATYGTTATPASIVGSYAIAPTLSDGGTGKLSNYTPTSMNGTLTVTPAPLVVTPADASREFGAPNPAFVGAISGIENSDAITASYRTTAALTSPVGTYPITATLNDQDNKLGNYSVTLNQGTLTITPAAASMLVVAGFPSPTTAGTEGTFMVTVQDRYGNTATGYVGSVHFSSSDTLASLPADYTFTAADDDGAHSFRAVFVTAGNQSLTATDTQSGSITGSQSGIVVTPAAANHFLVVAPAIAAANTPFDVSVTALDLYGNVDSNYQGTISFSTTDPDPGVILPPDYTFAAADAGVHAFTAGVGLVTPGDQTLTVTDTNGLMGSATITVMAPQTPPGGGGARGAGGKDAAAGMTLDWSPVGTLQTASPGVAGPVVSGRAERPDPGRSPIFPQTEEAIDQLFASGSERLSEMGGWSATFGNFRPSGHERLGPDLVVVRYN